MGGGRGNTTTDKAQKKTIHRNEKPTLNFCSSDSNSLSQEHNLSLLMVGVMMKSTILLSVTKLSGKGKLP